MFLFVYPVKEPKISREKEGFINGSIYFIRIEWNIKYKKWRELSLIKSHNTPLLWKQKDRPNTIFPWLNEQVNWIQIMDTFPKISLYTLHIFLKILYWIYK
jgi:hypothetical protein